MGSGIFERQSAESKGRKAFFKRNITVMRGIPQGSILVPILFTKSRNDLPDPIESNCKIFAYDIKFTIKLQRDLDKLIDWGVIHGTYILETKIVPIATI